MSIASITYSESVSQAEFRFGKHQGKHSTPAFIMQFRKITLEARPQFPSGQRGRLRLGKRWGRRPNHLQAAGAAERKFQRPSYPHAQYQDQRRAGYVAAPASRRPRILAPGREAARPLALNASLFEQ